RVARHLRRRTPRPRPGDDLQFIQPRVNTADRQGALLDDVIGNWWTIAAWGNDPWRLLGPTERDLGARRAPRLHRPRDPAAVGRARVCALPDDRGRRRHRG